MGDTSRRGRPSPVRRIAMEGASVVPRGFEHLREHSIGLPQVLFQSITHMAPAAAVAYSLYISVPDAQQALPLAVALALIACICAATAIGQLAKLFPSAGGMYTYAARPLGEEARHPRRAIPRAVVGSAVAIGLFYILCSYAWVFGAHFDSFVKQATGADPWRNLGKVFWGTGWILVFLAICNSIVANSNAAVNAATRVFYSLARNGLVPPPPPPPPPPLPT